MTTTLPNATNPWLNQAATIVGIKSESPGIVTYDIVIDSNDVASGYLFRPGQFNMIYLPGIGEAAISISGAPCSAGGPGLGRGTSETPERSGDPCSLSIVHTIREAGNVTQALGKLNVGARVGLRGPFGSSWPVQECIGKDVILVAGGIGMAPLRPVVYEILRNREQYGNVTLLLGARSADGLLYGDEIAEWQASIDVQQTVDRSSDDWNGHVGVVTALLERMPIPRPNDTLLMTCGPEVMMWYAIKAALDRGMNEQSAWVSLERNMNCAIGLCGHCQLGPEFLCKDGPVFRYDRVASILRVEGL